MEILRFTHRFFHFETRAWARALAGEAPTWQWARRLFSEQIFSRRQLKICEPRSFDEARKIHDHFVQREDALGIRVLDEASPLYPEGIRAHIPPERRPALLYLRGHEPPPEAHLVAIVGTRQPSELGQEAALSFAAYLGAIGLRVVSGLARGVDTLAHEQSLTNRTVAVLGAGVAEVYPEENQGLAENIVGQGGCLLSPFPIEQVPLPQNFPDRNELIAALAAGVIVIEGAEKSGASITGRQALAMSKTVVTLAQDYRTEFGRGAIRLQQDGALFVAREEDAVEAIFRRFGGFAGTLPKAKTARATFTLAQFQKSAQCGLPEAIVLLEEGILQGRIARVGSRYRLR